MPEAGPQLLDGIERFLVTADALAGAAPPLLALPAGAVLAPVEGSGTLLRLRIAPPDPARTLTALAARAAELQAALAVPVTTDAVFEGFHLKCYDGIAEPLDCTLSAALNTPADPPCLDRMHRQMEVDRAWWDVTSVGGKPFGEGVKIGQLDTGWSGHPEVDAARVDFANARGFSPGRADGFDNLQTTKVNSEPGHGTNCASISISGFGAAGGGAADPAAVVGVAPAATLLPIRVCDATADFRQSYLSQGLDYAVAQGCDVVTMSIGQLLPSVAVHNACQRAIAANPSYS